MRQLSLLALASAIALTAGLVLVLGGQNPSSSIAEGPPRHVMTVIEGTSTTSTVAVVLNAWFGVDHSEIESIEAEVRAESTTTSSTVPPTTTTTAPKRTTTTKAESKPSPKPPATTTTTAPPAPAGGYNSGFEADFYKRINSLRSSTGVAALSRSGDLDSLARSWAKWMGTNSKLAHSKNPSKLVGNGWASAGETVGKGGSVKSVFEAFKASGGHHSIMVGDFTHIGVGVWVDGKGTVWTAHLFGKK